MSVFLLPPKQPFKASNLTLPATVVQIPTQERHRRQIQNNEHRPRHYTWSLIDAHYKVINSTTNYTVWPWFPSLYMDFAEMATGVEKFADKQLQANTWDKQGSCSPAPASNFRLYFCPKHSTGSSRSACGSIADYYCKSWSCVSTGHISWDPPTKNDYISITRTKEHIYGSWPSCGQRLNPLTLTFTSEGKALERKEWMTGYSWGGREWSGDGDAGGTFTLRLSVQQKTIVVGPDAQTFLQPTPVNNPLVNLLNSSYALFKSLINDTTKTSDCWLCLSDQPPFYSAAGSTEPFLNETTGSRCRWNTSTITITAISSPGCCLGNIPANYSQYCLNSTQQHLCDIYLPPTRSGLRHGGYNMVYTPSGSDLTARLKGQYFIPGTNSLWACSTGTTACVNGDVLIASKGFCIQVYLIPKIGYISNEDMVTLIAPDHFPLRQKRELVTTMTLTLLLGLGATGAVTGVSALAVNHQQLSALSLQIDEDLKNIETSISAMQESLSSLAEMVLQNRRGLDLLLLSKGGLCVALKEECCFYTDNKGIVLDSMAILKRRLKDREMERQQAASWFNGLFSLSPWLTTLLSALLGPIIIFLLICTIGPCCAGRILRYLQTRLSTLDDALTSQNTTMNMLLTNQHKYSPLPTEEKAPLMDLTTTGEGSDSEADMCPDKVIRVVPEGISLESIPSAHKQPCLDLLP